MIKRAVIGAAALAMLTACASASPPRPSEPPTQTYAPIANLARATALNADSRFGADLLALLGQPTDNVVLSPYSIAVALQMALEGAKGETAAQMAKVLHLPDVTPEQLAATAATLRRDLTALDDPSKQVTLRIANRMWPQAGFPILPPYTASLRDGFGVNVQQLDFADDPPGARETINQAVSDETSGKIPKLLSEDLDPMTRLVLTNAIYLKAGWTSPFQAADTRPDTFNHADGTSAEAPFMHQVGELDYANRDGYQLVRLPYGSGDLAMTLIVPDGDLAPVERTLQQKGLAAVLGGPLEPTEVTLALPRFKIRTHAELAHPLEQLGMTDAFKDGIGRLPRHRRREVCSSRRSPTRRTYRSTRRAPRRLPRRQW